MQNQLYEATVKGTNEKVRVYKLGNSSKQAGKWCNYDRMEITYTDAEIALGKEIKALTA